MIGDRKVLQNVIFVQVLNVLPLMIEKNEMKMEMEKKMKKKMDLWTLKKECEKLWIELQVTICVKSPETI